MPDATESGRLAAVQTLRTRGDIEAKSTLGNLTGQTRPVAEAAAAAILAIDREMQLW